MESKTGRRVFIALGIVFLLNAVFFITVAVLGGGFPNGYEFAPLGMSVMAFCLAYLYPQFKDNDERSKRIKEKALFLSFFIMIIVFLTITLLFELQLLNLDGSQTVGMISTVYIIIVFTSLVVVSRRI